MALRAFKITEFKRKNIRLRSFARHHDILKELYKEEKTILSLKLHNFSDFTFEIKTCNEE